MDEDWSGIRGEFVQGYTNLLMTLLMSVATLIFDKSTAALSIQILGAGILLATALTTVGISEYILPRDGKHRSLLRVLVFICALSYYPLMYWSLMGMETGLLTLLLVLGVLSALTYTSSKKTIHMFSVSVFFGLAYLTRNDLIIFAALVWVYIFWEILASSAGNDRKSLALLLAAIIFYGVFVVGQSAFQYFYYGEMLPNTYTLKLTGMPLFDRLANGAGFVELFLIGNAFILILASLETILNCHPRKLLLLSIVFASIGYEIYVGGDPWSYWRIMSPTMPLLTILFISAANTFLTAIRKSRTIKGYFFRIPIFPKRYIAPLFIGSITFLGLLQSNWQFMGKIPLLSKPWETRVNEIRVNTAVALNQLTMSEATVGVYAAGSIPYFTDDRAIDFLGKSDRYIAHLPPDVSGAVAWSGMHSVPGHNKYDLNYSIKTLQPTYVEDFHWGSQDLSQWGESRYVKVEYKGVSLFLLRIPLLSIGTGSICPDSGWPIQAARTNRSAGRRKEGLRETRKR